jgi:glycosyltransferase involved in cell wall biosynthesis
MRKKFTVSVVLPMWNEAEAASAVLSRVMEARKELLRNHTVKFVEVLVADDGSTDGTAEIVESFPGIRVVKLPHRGYGAALKSGFQAATGDLLGFMDGDNTCDLASFGPMTELLVMENVDMVHGNRLHRESRMPAQRRIANLAAGRFISILVGKKIIDSCTGIRVFRRSLLPLIDTLPDDLSFSPALTTRVLLSRELTMAEIPVSYRERLGDSKLSMVKDGWRFLRQVLLAFGEERRQRRGVTAVPAPALGPGPKAGSAPSATAHVRLSSPRFP